MTMRDLFSRYFAVSMQMCIFYVLCGTGSCVRNCAIWRTEMCINLLFRHRSEFRRRRGKKEIMIGKKGEGMQTRIIQFAIEFLGILCCNLMFVRKLLNPCVKTLLISAQIF